MTEQEIKNIVEFAIQEVIGDREEMTADEANQITLLVAEMITNQGEMA